MRRATTALFSLLILGTALGATTQAPVTPDQQFVALADRYIADMLQRNPTAATYLGVHTHDHRLEDASQAALKAESAASRRFRAQLAAIPAARLSPANRADQQMVLASIDGRLHGEETLRLWAKDPDRYPGSCTNSAFSLIKRDFAPADVRLRALIARERLMPAYLAAGRRNLSHPPKIYTEIALSQIDGNIDFFATTVPAAFPKLTNPTLKAEFRQANDAVILALKGYKAFLKTTVLPRSDGQFAIGTAAYRQKLKHDEMIELPLDTLVAIGEKDLAKNQAAFNATAKLIDSVHSPREIYTRLAKDHPTPQALIGVTQGMLDSIRQFIVDKQILTIPASPPARVAETPAFLRATTSASMDTPGPFEPKAGEAYYYMTLPDPTWKATDSEDFMQQWYYASIANVSVHETYPGHYIQFLYAKHYPSALRKVLGASSNSEGWAHYCEAMMIDQGFHAEDPRYQLAQLQDALLRDARLIVGIRLHTGQMTVDQAVTYFQKEAYQPLPVAQSEAKRGTMDPTYGYYTLGKLMILKLRDDYQAAKGKAYSLRHFHDAFIQQGPLPLPLIRQAMLGTEGDLF